MKRFIIFGAITLAFVALIYWGNRLLASVLDAELPGLLTTELGIPVTLAPLKARISTLSVDTPKLVMGDPASPALVATGVSVSLDWSDLLRGDIRLRRASGESLMVKPTLWPGNDDPWPTDYQFIEPYLPDYLAVDSVSYVYPDGGSHLFTHPQWQREAGAVKIQWRDKWDSQSVSLSGALDSLEDLLKLASLKLEMTAIAEGQDQGITTTVAIKPRSDSGYSLSGTVSADGMTAKVDTGNNKAWALPDKSTTTIDELDLGKFKALLDQFSGEAAATASDEWLQAALPGLNWPQHSGQVTIAKISWQNEVALENTFDFTTGPKGVSLSSIASKGPGGALGGDIDVMDDAGHWTISAKVEVTSAPDADKMTSLYEGADWAWSGGNATLQGQGHTWETLLNSLTGDVSLSLESRGGSKPTVKMAAKLDNQPNTFSLKSIDIQLGKGRITGSLALTGDEQKVLSAKLQAQQVNLDFLIPDSDPDATAGLAVPEFIDALPDMNLDWQLNAKDLSVANIMIKQGGMQLSRSHKQGEVRITAQDPSGGTLTVKLAATTSPQGRTSTTMDIDLARLDIPKIFQQAEGLVDNRTSGTISFSGAGENTDQVFATMQGKAALSMDFRPDNDWQRAAKNEEQLDLSGEARLVMRDKKVAGVEITNLLVDSVLQNVTGTLSMVDGRKPWLEADLVSSKLDIDELRQFDAGSPTGATGQDPLQSIKKIGDARLSLKVKTLKLENALLSNAAVQLSTAPDSVTIDQLDFFLDQGQLSSKGAIKWQQDVATLAMDAKVTELAIDRILTAIPKAQAVPLSGTISVRASGNSVDTLLAGLSGDIKLSASADTPGGAGEISMTANRTSDGMLAVIHRFIWEGSDLKGSVQYRQADPPLLEVEISGGALSLLAWETDPTVDANKDKQEDKDGVVGSAARAGVKFVGDVVSAPMKLFGGPKEAEPGAKLFSSTPLDFNWMKNNRVTVKGKLDQVISREASARDLEFSASLSDGALLIETSAGTVNKGSATGKINLNVAETPATLDISATFHNLRGKLVNKADIPRSGSLNLSSQGISEAELAANANGLAFLELGSGPLDYSSLTLLTADVATTALQTLIPGAKKKPPQLDCAVTLAIFKDGIGTTPYGYAARTKDANLVGQFSLNLKKELLHMNFSSSNRSGMGISVSSVFSNTVEIEGPLTDPKIVPNTTGLLWRSWAAVLTGGLSLLGETVAKRMLASDNPCDSVKKHIHKDFCGTPEAAGASTMICPAT